MNKPVFFLILASLILSACSAGNIVVYSEDRVLTREELKTALMSENFNEKNRARRQLDTLAPEERLELLRDVYASPDSASRTMAVAEMGKLPPELVRADLEKISREDQDPDIRELAQMYLGGDLGGGGDDDEGDDEGDDEEE